MDHHAHYTPDRLTLRKREAARALGVSERTLHTLLSTGAIPSLKVGRAVLIPLDGLQAFIDCRTRRGDQV